MLSNEQLLLLASPSFLILYSSFLLYITPKSKSRHYLSLAVISPLIAISSILLLRSILAPLELDIFATIYYSLNTLLWINFAATYHFKLYTSFSALGYLIALIQNSVFLTHYVDWSIPIDNMTLSLPITATALNFSILFLELIRKPLADDGNLIIDGRLISHEYSSSLFSYLTFSWINPLLDLGLAKPLEEEDLPHLTKSDQMSEIIENWIPSRKDTDNIFHSLIFFTRKFGIFQLSFSVMTTFLDFANPYFVNRILNFIQNQKADQPSDWKTGLLLLAGMFLANMVRELLYSQIELSGRHWGIHLRSVLVHEILSKSMRRASSTSPKSLKDDEEDDDYASTGKVVSLMSADVGEIRNFVTDLHRPLVDTPLTIVIGISGLWTLLGPSAFAGLFIVVISSPITGLALKSIYKIFKTTKILRDKRIQATNEALQGIRIIKYMSWEPQFIKKIREARESELTSRYFGLLGYIGLIIISWGSSILVTFTSFFFYTVVFKHQLDAATAFTCITLLGIVSGTLNDLSQIVSEVLNIRLVIQRIQSFLNEEEMDSARESNLSASPKLFKNSTELGFINAEFQYYITKAKTDTSVENKKEAKDEESEPLLGDISTPEESNAFQLHSIDLKFPVGQLTTIIGPTGSGKTSLLLALLGEMKKLRGDRLLPNPNFMDIRDGKTLHHGIAYVAQTSWLLNATIRDNITFGETYDADRYMKTLRACALIRDLETFDGGDLTEIGEKGVNLSGGQKQRISLARATYSRASYILLDDPLSAVDSPTAKHLFEECILGALKGRTILLVSHSASLVVPKSNYVALMKNGTIVASGTPKEIMTRPEVIDLFVGDHDTYESSVSKSVQDYTENSTAISSMGTKLVDKEGKATGSVKLETYITYLKACGGVTFIFWIMIGFIVTTAAEFLSSWWIQQWTDSTAKAQAAILDGIADAAPAFTPLFYIGIFGAISLIELIALMFRFVVQFTGGWYASRSLHHSLLDAVLGSPLRFFEVTPVGRLINRFSKDLSDIDGGVMFTVTRFATLIISALTNLFFVTYVTPIFSVAVFFLVFYYLIAKRYLSASRELKRIESVSSSPIYAQFSETLNGLQTIRAYKVEKRIMYEMQEKVDSNHRAFFYLFAANRWLYFRNAMLSGIIVFCAGFAVIVSGVSAGWAGLAFNFASQLTSKMNGIVQTHASMEMAMNSVERVEEYSQIDQEPPAIIETSRPEQEWPSTGKICFKNLSIRYDKELPLVLKNLSFTINSREKVGIVGRTGAGKSTISLCLFRILPFATGTIEIDGIDISKIGLRDLRSRLTIIAQDATLFAGTIRSNLDPVNEHDDLKIWQVLKMSHFMDTLQQKETTNEEETDESTKLNDLKSYSLTLDDRVEENGGNFSQGQRQLLCLARALLRESRIIFLDEATASVDRDTDSKIQDTIRSQFNNGTVLTVAHRLRTVIDYDRIIVLDQGEIAEIGTPYELLELNGIFNEMCKESGEYAELVSVAQKEHAKRNAKQILI